MHASSDNDRDLFPSVPRSQTSHNCALYMVKSSFVYRELLAQILRAGSAPSLDVRQKNIMKRKKCSKFKRQMLMDASEIQPSTKLHDWFSVTFICADAFVQVEQWSNVTGLFSRSCHGVTIRHYMSTSSIISTTQE